MIAFDTVGKLATAAFNEFTRKQIREDGFYRRIFPPTLLYRQPRPGLERQLIDCLAIVFLGLTDKEIHCVLCEQGPDHRVDIP